MDTSNGLLEEFTQKSGADFGEVNFLKLVFAQGLVKNNGISIENIQNTAKRFWL